MGEATVRPAADALSEEIEANLQVTSFHGTNHDLDSILVIKFHDVNRRAKHHFMMFTRLAVYSFLQIVMVLALSGAAAIALFLLSREGWQKGDLGLLILFAVTATAAALYASLPRIFRVNENFRANALAYTNILQLGDQIRTYAYTSDAPGAEPLLPFLMRIDRSLAAYRTIAFNFDMTQAPAVSALLSNLVNAAKERPDHGAPHAPQEPEAERREGPSKVQPVEKPEETEMQDDPAPAKPVAELTPPVEPAESESNGRAIRVLRG